jgi:hypothetical protein
MSPVAIVAPSLQRFTALHVPVWVAAILLVALVFVVYVLWKSRQD